MSQLDHEFVGKKFWVDYSEFSSGSIQEVTVVAVLKETETALVKIGETTSRHMYKLSDLKTKEFFTEAKPHIVLLRNVTRFVDDGQYEEKFSADVFVDIVLHPNLDKEMKEKIQTIINSFGDVNFYELIVEEIKMPFLSMKKEG